MKVHQRDEIAKLSPSLNFSWAEMVFNLDLPHPPNHPPTHQPSRKVSKPPNTTKHRKAKLIRLISRPQITKVMNLVRWIFIKLKNFITVINSYDGVDFNHSNIHTNFIYLLNESCAKTLTGVIAHDEILWI